MSADYEGALLQLTITGRTSPVRCRPSTSVMIMIMNMIMLMIMIMIIVCYMLYIFDKQCTIVKVMKKEYFALMSVMITYFI